MSRKRNEFGCAPNLEKELCAYHGQPLVNRNGCEHGDPQGGFRWRAPKKQKARPITVDVEFDGREFWKRDQSLGAGLLEAGMSQAAVDSIEARGSEGFYRVRLTFNRRGKIEKAQILPFTEAYRKFTEKAGS